MTFAEADAQYEIVKQRYLAGALTDEQYDDQLHSLMVLDDEGRWWAKSRTDGNWHYYDAATAGWIASAPPVAPPPLHPLPLPAQPQEQTLGPSPAVTGEQAPLPKWAAVAPAAHAAPAAATSAALVKPAQGAGPDLGQPTASYSAADFRPLPELGGSLKIILAVLSFFVPVLGIALFLIYRQKPAQADRSAARLFLILGIVSLALTGLCAILMVAAQAAVFVGMGG